MAVRGYGCVYGVLAWCLFVCASRVAGTKDGLECMQTIYGTEKVYNKPLSVTAAEKYKPKEPSPDDLPLYMDPCSELSDSKLAINWKLLASKATGDFGTRVILCLKKAQRNSNLTEELSCYNFSILNSEKRSEIHCWAAIPSYDNIILVKAYVSVYSLGAAYNLFSEIHTLGVDQSCKMDTIWGPRVTRIHGCNSSGRFTLTDGAEVKVITAKGESDDTRHIAYRVENGIAEFKLPAYMEGRYNLTIVLFRPDLARYFTFVRKIYVFCSGGTTTDFPMPDSSVSPSSGMSFPLFAVVMTLALLLLIFAGVVAFAFCCCSRREQNMCCRRAPSQRRSEMLPLNNERDKSSREEGDTSVQNGRSFLPLRKTDETDARDASALNSLATSQTSCQRSPSIARNMSAAMLPKFNELGRYKNIMFLPLSYDHYIRDLVQCLRQLFSFQDRVSCQCIHDQQILAEYSKNKYDWIDSVLKDDNFVVLVLCFTSLDCQIREATCVDDILEQCKLGGNKPRCRLVFLNLTGIDYGPNDYHGETFLVRDEADCEGLVKSLFAACGFTAEKETEILEHALQSPEYSQYIRMLLHHDT